MTDQPPPTLSLDNHLSFALYGASMAMNRVYKPMLDSLGITYPQYLVLHALWECDRRTVGAIAERLALESSTITPLLKRMAATGLVVRERDPDDERHVRVVLTPQGRAMRARLCEVTARAFARTGLSVDELHALTTRIRTLRDTLTCAAPAG